MKQLLIGLCLGAMLGGGLVKALSEPAATQQVAVPAALQPSDAPHTAVATSPTQALPPTNLSSAIPPGAATTTLPAAALGSPGPAVTPALLSAPAISLSEEHFRMVSPKPKDKRPLTIEELHQKIAAEPRDDSWALEVQMHWRNFLAQHTPSPDFDVVSVECRRTLCELAAFGNTPGADKRWDQALQTAKQEAWAQQFTNTNTHITEQNGRAVMLTILERRQP